MTQNKLILVIEDNEDTRFVFSAILNYDGYRIAEAANGRDGVTCALELRPDLIITDIDMPVNGRVRRGAPDPR